MYWPAAFFTDACIALSSSILELGLEPYGGWPQFDSRLVQRFCSCVALALPLIDFEDEASPGECVSAALTVELETLALGNLVGCSTPIVIVIYAFLS